LSSTANARVEPLSLSKIGVGEFGSGSSCANETADAIVMTKAAVMNRAKRDVLLTILSLQNRNETKLGFSNDYRPCGIKTGRSKMFYTMNIHEFAIFFNRFFLRRRSLTMPIST
jgi:hypothetical protein